MRYTLDEITRDVRVAIDENTAVTLLTDGEGNAIDADTLELDDIIRQKAKDALWWLDRCNGFDAAYAMEILEATSIVSLPVQFYSAYIYHIAYLVHVCRGDERAAETERIAKKLLALNTCTRYAPGYEEPIGDNSIGDIVESGSPGDGGEEESIGDNSIGREIPQNFGPAKIKKIRL